MPPKRKAPLVSDQAPPSKRTTRSRGPLEETQSVVPPVDRPHRKRRVAAKKKAEAGDDESERKATEERPAPKRGRPPTAAKAQVIKQVDAEPLKRGRGRPKKLKSKDISETSKASSSKVTVDILQASVNAEDSPDELLLSSPPQSRPVTPERAVSPDKAIRMSRAILEAVEIASPFSQARSHNAVHHPSPHKIPATPSRHANTLQTRTSPVSTSPRKQVTPRTPQLQLPRRVEVDNKPNLFAPDAPQPPIQTDPEITTFVTSPRRGKVVQTPQKSPSRLPRVLPSHLHTHLHAQKRATLQALNYLSVPDGVDPLDEESEPSTNTVAYQQLTSLLTGTVERGEGNSCLLIGPRGSGKTQVSRRW
jgi:hypothetical protein